MRRQNTKLISVSLTEWDLPSMAKNSQTAQTIPPEKMIHPMMDVGIKKIPERLNQGRFIGLVFRVNRS